MEATLSIQQFNVLLSQGEENEWLSQVLRALTTLEKPEDVRLILDGEPGAGWRGWG